MSVTLTCSCEGKGINVTRSGCFTQLARPGRRTFDQGTLVLCASWETDLRDCGNCTQPTSSATMVRVWAHFVRCCVAVTSHPQPLLPKRARVYCGCQFGTHPCDATHPGRMMGASERQLFACVLVCGVKVDCGERGC